MINKIKNIMFKNKAFAIVTITNILFIICNLITLFFNFKLGLGFMAVILIIYDINWLIYFWKKELKKEHQIKNIIKHNKPFIILSITFLSFIISSLITLFFDFKLGVISTAIISIISDINWLIYSWKKELKNEIKIQNIAKNNKTFLISSITYFLFIINNLITLFIKFELGLQLNAFISVISNVSWLHYNWKKELKNEN